MSADMVDHPPHYTAHPSGVECVDIAEHLSFNLGNALKYVWRAKNKGREEEDLKKALWYVRREQRLLFLLSDADIGKMRQLDVVSMNAQKTLDAGGDSFVLSAFLKALIRYGTEDEFMYENVLDYIEEAILPPEEDE